MEIQNRTGEKLMTQAEYAKTLETAWPAPFVARSETGKFTGGCIAPRTVSNRESTGDKVPGRITVGRQVAYPTKPYAIWLAKRFFGKDEA